MAITDALFSVGDLQNFVLEIPADTLHAPVDSTFNRSILDGVLEIGDGTLNSPVDWTTNNNTANDTLIYALTLSSGATNFAF